MMIRRALRRLAMAAAFRPSPNPGPIVAICHCHHIELVSELGRVIGRLPPAAALHITSSSEAVLARWDGLKRLPMRPILHRVENRGRDIRPFFEVAKGLSIDPDTLVLKLHGKRSDYSRRGKAWRRDLLNGLLPDRRAPGFVAQRFRDNPRLGMLGAPGSFIAHPVYWGRNRDTIGRVMSEHCGAAPAEGDLGFFAGSMFWMRGSLLSRLLPVVDLAAFEPEPLPQDGAYAHAVERIIGMAALSMGWEVSEVGDPASLDPARVRDRKIPYI